MRQTENSRSRVQKSKDTKTTSAERRTTWMSVRDVLTELDIKRRTWQRWRALGRTPECSRLPNGELRIKRCDFDTWMESLNTRRAS
ncbi:helix-turn-helix domain-containing protein [Nonomuraea longicatena]|uniref:Helix-turn-helix domain-containing protein n=1 Tax=Nonomuraea longicatena TaxID=83682 RepID=A0ABP4BJ83_9ACTN